MTLQDLPQEIQNELRSSRLELHNTWKCNDAYHVCFTDATGTRYFAAVRVCMAWNNKYKEDRDYSDDEVDFYIDTMEVKNGTVAVIEVDVKTSENK